MKSQKQKHLAGYTIIEVMMFLLVSSALLGSVMTMVSGRQERIRFTKSVEGFQLQLNDVLNDVATGYYPSAEDFKCVSSPIDNKLSFPINSSSDLGTNAGCVFLGKAIEFKSDGIASNYKIYTIAGAKAGTDLATSKTELLGNSNPGIIQKEEIPADIEVVKIISLSNPDPLSGVAILSDFSNTAALDEKVSGNGTRTVLYEVPAGFLSNAGKPSMRQSSKGIVLCLQQAGLAGRKAAITLGADGGRLGADLKIDDSNLPTECN